MTTNVDARMDASVSNPQTRQWMMDENDARTLGELLTALTDDLSTLLRKEVQLARVETTEKVSQLAQNLIGMVAGGLLAYTGLIALVIAAIVGLSAILPFWLSALIVGLLLIVVGAMLIQSGRSALKQMSLAPEKTIDSIKADADMVKEKIS